MLHAWSGYQSLMTLHGHDGAVDLVAFSPDGKRIISGSGENTIKVWDSATGAELMTLRVHWVGSIFMASPGNGTLNTMRKKRRFLAKNKGERILI